jgi:hypothetical protein
MLGIIPFLTNSRAVRAERSGMSCLCIPSKSVNGDEGAGGVAATAEVASAKSRSGGSCSCADLFFNVLHYLGATSLSHQNTVGFDSEEKPTVQKTIKKRSLNPRKGWRKPELA